MLDPGTFDRKISFTVPTTTVSAMGAPSKVFIHSFYMWMNREQLTGSEQAVNNRIVVPTKFIYRGHYSSAINETLQIVDGGVNYNILSANPIERNMFIEVIAEKITE
jgi:hypothetical protein